MMKLLMKLFTSKDSMFDMMTYKVITSSKIEDIVANVEKSCENNKFALLHNYVYHEVVKSKGFPIDRKVFIYEICVAKVAALVLTEEPSFAPFMPCRIAIYEENGSVVISTQNMDMILDTLDKNSELFQSTSELFNNLKSLLTEIKG